MSKRCHNISLEKREWRITLLLILLSNALLGQVITHTPINPNQSDLIHIIFHADKGNKMLSGYSGEVYAHTGLITSKSTSSSDWKYVVADWNVNLPILRMTKIGVDSFELWMDIANLYDNPPGEELLSLAFVFRSSTGHLTGKSDQDGDLFVPLNQKGTYNYSSHTWEPGILRISGTEGSTEIRILDQSLISVHHTHLQEEIADSSFSVINQSVNTTAQLTELDDSLIIEIKDTRVAVNKKPIRIQIIENGKSTLVESPGYLFKPSDNSRTLNFKLSPEEVIQGTGSRAIEINRNGQRLPVYNLPEYGYSNGAELLNICSPFITTNKGYGLFIDNHYNAIWDLGSFDSHTLTYQSFGGTMKYYYVGGSKYSEIFKNYQKLIGTQTMLPIWALGYMQSKFGYESRNEANQIIQELQDADFPIDVLILDLYWFGDQSVMGNLEWDESRFPEPDKMITNWRSKGIKTVLISETYVTRKSKHFGFLNAVGYFGKNSGGGTYLLPTFWAGEAALLDVSRKNVNDWMWSKYEPLLEDGVAGWWTDLAEPELHPFDMTMGYGSTARIHNVYNLIWSKSIFENQNNYDPDRRVFNLTRSGWPGMRRYGAVSWSGDVSRSFSGLQAQIPIMLGASMSGYSFMHSDAGGFTSFSPTPDPELYARWLQFAAFTPILRVHGVGYDTEPTAFTQETQDIVRNAIQLRYDLLPYLYTLVYENHISGAPLVSPMDYSYPDNLNLQNINDQFLLGNDLLIAPVINQGEIKRPVTFPPGTWYSIHDENEVYSGNQTSLVDAPLEEIPIFINAGSFIPYRPGLKNTDDYRLDTLWLHYYPDVNGDTSHFVLYDDDKMHPEPVVSGNYQLSIFQGVSQEENHIISINKAGNYPGAPADVQLNLLVKRVSQQPSNILFREFHLPQLQTFEAFQQSETGWFYEESEKRVYIRVLWDSEFGDIKIESLTLPVVKFEQAISLSIYPNPVTDQLTIESKDPDFLVDHIILYDGTGKVVFEQEGTATNKFILDVTHLPSGSYHLTLKCGINIQTEDIVVFRR